MRAARRTSTTTVRLGVAAAASLLLVTGCTAVPPDGTPSPDGPRPSEPGPNASEPTAETEPDPADLAVPVEAELDGVPARVEVGPAVRDGDLSTLLLRVESTGDDSISSSAFGFVFLELDGTKPNSVRLLDTGTRDVRLVAHDSEGVRLTHGSGRAGPGEVLELAVVHAAPEGDATAVLLPQVGLVEDVPVVDAADLPAGADLPLPEEVLARYDLAADDVVAPVVPAAAHRVLLDGQVRASEDDGTVDVEIASDVLFAVDSDALSTDADAALRAAADQITGHDAGRLEVVGHTDDVADEAYNQDLSERRAHAVADRLGDLVDLDAYEVEVVGRGETEPAVDGTSDEDRRRNRRVELRFEPADDDAPAPEREAPSGELPETDAPVGTADEGVLLADEHEDGREVHVEVEEVRRVDGVLVGTLRATLRSGDPGPVSRAFTQVAWDSRGGLAPDLQFAATGVSLLVGHERVFPLDHAMRADAEEGGTRYPLADLMLNEAVERGGSITATVVWPDVGGDTVTVDVPPVTFAGGRVSSGMPWRVTDVPVR